MASAHDPPPASFEAKLTPERLTVVFMIEEPQYDHWFGRPAAQLLDLDDDALDAVAEEAEDLLARACPVRFDGIEVRPVVEFVDFQEGFEVNDFLNFVAVTAVYGCKGLPRRLELSWHRYDGPDDWALESVDGIFECDNDLRELKLSEGEPGFTWHASRAPRAQGPPPPPPAPHRARADLPLPALLVWVAGLIAGVRVLRRRRSRALAWLGGSLAAGSLVCLLPWGRVELPLPWSARVALPDAAEARYIFESLQRNVYRAFDYDSEGEIYDALAASVADELLDRLYDEVYQSLILREEGGAVARVRGVRIVDATIELPESADRAQFGVAARWQVTGTVEHWGHRHLRTNQYTAHYTIRGFDRGWKIVDVDVRDQERIGGDDGNRAI